VEAGERAARMSGEKPGAQTTAKKSGVRASAPG